MRSSNASQLLAYEAEMRIRIEPVAPIVGLRAELADVERRMATHVAARGLALQRIVTLDDPTPARVALGRLDDEIKALTPRLRYLKRLVDTQSPA